jgi:hypothetical protein
MSQLIKDRNTLDDAVAAFIAKGGVITVKKAKSRELKISKTTRAITQAYADSYDAKAKSKA